MNTVCISTNKSTPPENGNKTQGVPSTSKSRGNALLSTHGSRPMTWSTETTAPVCDLLCSACPVRRGSVISSEEDMFLSRRVGRFVCLSLCVGGVITRKICGSIFVKFLQGLTFARKKHLVIFCLLLFVMKGKK